MNEAPCSWRVSTYRIEDREMASTRRIFSSPGIPKTCVTPSFSRHATIRSAVSRSGSAMFTRLEDTTRAAPHQGFPDHPLPWVISICWPHARGIARASRTCGQAAGLPGGRTQEPFLEGQERLLGFHVLRAAGVQDVLEPRAAHEAVQGHRTGPPRVRDPG